MGNRARCRTHHLIKFAHEDSRTSKDIQPSIEPTPSPNSSNSDSLRLTLPSCAAPSQRRCKSQCTYRVVEFAASRIVRTRCKSLCRHVRKQHGQHAMQFANKFRHRKAQMLVRRLRQEIKITGEAIEQNASHIDFIKNHESELGAAETTDLLEKNRSVLSDVLRILLTSLDDIATRL